MSFQAYLDTIREKTGLTPTQFRDAARARGLLGPSVRATELTDWLKREYGLGLGHARALWTVFKQEGWVGAAASAKAPPGARARGR